ncbi:hypothetical protein CALCODRAFT_38740 [Calocera cornea HHB12733]|uniref:Uncharacterized protein n=1 Tax=Calocera cornea HHB12733 TaxID=1353952 RepID=A0A165DX35_9BASI|nr:hypothetical protein CALCODRAFT_38740 [Calocera cornea HHB12733]
MAWLDQARRIRAVPARSETFSYPSRSWSSQASPHGPWSTERESRLVLTRNANSTPYMDRGGFSPSLFLRHYSRLVCYTTFSSLVAPLCCTMHSIFFISSLDATKHPLYISSARQTNPTAARTLCPHASPFRSCVPPPFVYILRPPLSLFPSLFLSFLPSSPLLAPGAGRVWLYGKAHDADCIMTSYADQSYASIRTRSCPIQYLHATQEHGATNRKRLPKPRISPMA